MAESATQGLKDLHPIPEKAREEEGAWKRKKLLLAAWGLALSPRRRCNYGINLNILGDFLDLMHSQDFHKT